MLLNADPSVADEAKATDLLEEVHDESLRRYVRMARLAVFLDNPVDSAIAAAANCTTGIRP